jgi:hypothetical protein
MVVFLAVIMVTTVALASDPYPVNFECASSPDRPEEADFCQIYKIQLAATGMAVYEFDRSRPHFMVIVMPTARDGYLSVAVASNFMYPPLAGLALSAHLSSYLVIPVDSEDDLVDVAGYMANMNIKGISEWMQWFAEKTWPDNRPDRGLEVRR